MRWIAVICVTLLATVPGCAVVDWIFGEPGSYYDEIESPVVYTRGYGGSDSSWIGRQSTELVDSRGQPDMILEGRPRFGEYRDGIPKVSYIYRAAPGDGAGRLACIDAYIVLQATGEIVDYYCR